MRDTRLGFQPSSMPTFVLRISSRVSAELDLPRICPYPDCGCRRFKLVRTIEREVRDLDTRTVRIARYMCVRCRRTFRIYPEGVGRSRTTRALQTLVLLLLCLGLSYAAVSRLLATIGIRLSVGFLYSLMKRHSDFASLRRSFLDLPPRYRFAIERVDNTRCLRLQGKRVNVALELRPPHSVQITIQPAAELENRELADLKHWLEQLASRLEADMTERNDAVDLVEGHEQQSSTPYPRWLFLEWPLLHVPDSPDALVTGRSFEHVVVRWLDLDAPAQQLADLIQWGKASGSQVTVRLPVRARAMRDVSVLASAEPTMLCFEWSPEDVLEAARGGGELVAWTTAFLDALAARKGSWHVAALLMFTLHDIDALAPFVYLMHGLGIGDVFVWAHPYRRAASSADASALLDDEPTLRRVLREITDLGQRLGMRVQTLGVLGRVVPPHARFAEPWQACSLPWEELHVSRSGDAFPCCVFATAPAELQHEGTLGNIIRDRLESIWQGTRMAAFRQRLRSSDPPALCRICQARAWCRLAREPGYENIAVQS